MANIAKAMKASGYELKDIPIGTYTITTRITTPDGKVFTPMLSAQITYDTMLGNRFTPDANHPIFFGPRWKDFPMGSAGDPNEAVYKKRSTTTGAGSVVLEIGHF